MENFTVKSEDIQVDAYLDLFTLGKNRYIVGIFHPGITIYKQQVRALNIFHCLYKKGIFKNNDDSFHVGIIGGGIAGVTFATALAKIGVKITILESKPVLMPMQYGCDTRFVHPQIYNWPDPQSAFPYAVTPILTWKADTASNVAKQILNGFYKLQNQIPDPKKIKVLLNVDENLEISDDKVTEGLISVSFVRNSQNKRYAKKRDKRKFNLLIYATGFGVEYGVNGDSEFTPSYWRNDEFGQPHLGDQVRKYSISGTGDGALADLFRLKLRGFSLETFVSRISKHNNYSKLIFEISAIKEEWKKSYHSKNIDAEPGWLFSKFEDIPNDIYAYIFDEYLTAKFINERVEVFLYGKEDTLGHCIKVNKVSMLHAFILFILSSMVDLFKYIKGDEVKYVSYDKCYQTKDKKRLEGTVIIRHGTDRGVLLKRILSFAESETLGELKKKQEHDSYYNQTDLIFGYSELFNILHPEISNKTNKEFDFFTPETQLVCSSSIATLASNLRNYQLKNYKSERIRVCLHRVVQKGEETFYQRIIPYFGQSGGYKNEGIGHIYSSRHGIVGISLQTGKSILLKKEDDFQDMQQTYGFPNLLFGEAALAVPILCKKEGSSYTTNLVLFVETEIGVLFDDQDVKDLIKSSMAGFVEYIENLVINSRQLVMNEIAHEPDANNSKFEFEQYRKYKSFSVFSVNLTDDLSQEPDSFFQKFYSFDISFFPLESELPIQWELDN